HAPLGLSLSGSLWLRWQLQNRGLLALTECCQQHDPTIRKLQCVVMHRNLLFVNLPKDRRLVLDHFTAPRYQAGREARNRIRKGQLRPRTNADRYTCIFRCCEPSRPSTKITCGEFVANLRRPRLDAVETVVTHLGPPTLGKPLS